MPDREKVIKGLECHRIDNNHRINCADCPYYVDDDNHINCVNDLHDDAIELLKEQKAKLVRIDEDSVHCPSCGNELFTFPRQKFCDECGQELKWDA